MKFLRHKVSILMFILFSHSSFAQQQNMKVRQLLTIPSASPTPSPTFAPSLAPTQSQVPSLSPTFSPSLAPTQSQVPSLSPTFSPSLAPTQSRTPSLSPTSSPSLSTSPTFIPSVSPSLIPTSVPTPSPSSPTITPSEAPTQTMQPSSLPTQTPIPAPTSAPSSTQLPSSLPSVKPSPAPTPGPSLTPTSQPSALPTISTVPSSSPTQLPTSLPTLSLQPTISLLPTPAPTPRPTLTPTSSPTPLPTLKPTPSPTPLPTPSPTISHTPTSSPTFAPTMTHQPTFSPSRPTQNPTPSPSLIPTPSPSTSPSPVPTSVPTDDTFVSVIVSVKFYVNLGSSISSTPNSVQQEELKSQLSNLTKVPEARMYGFSLSLDPGFAPTPQPTNIPTPVPTPVPTGICGCPRRYYAYIGVTVTDEKLCSLFNPEAVDPYICCLYCCARQAGVCSEDYSNTTLYDIDTRRLLEEEEEDPYENKLLDFTQNIMKSKDMIPNDSNNQMIQPRHLRAHTAAEGGPAHRQLASFYWDVYYKVLAPASELGYDTITSTELATNIFNVIDNLAIDSLVLTNVTSIYPEKAGSNTLVAQGVTRSPTPQPSSPAPSKTPTHLPSQSVVPSFAPTMVPIPAPVALPTLSPSHAPTKYHVIHAEIYIPETSFNLRLFCLVIPIFAIIIGILMVLCVRYCRDFCWCCFPTEGLEGLVMFSSFAGNEASAAKQDEKYIKQHREGAVYTWAKQFHAKYLVMGTPTGLKLSDSFKEVEMQQMEPYTRLLNKGQLLSPEDEEKEEFSKNDELLRVVDDGGFIAPRLPQMVKKYDANGDEIIEDENEKIGRLEKIAVQMAMKQQELVNALLVAEERQNDLHQELSTLRNSKGKRAKLTAINQSTMELGGGEHSNFLDSWLSGGALIDGNVVEAPQYTGGLTEQEQQVKAQIKATNKAKKKAAEAKARRKSQRMSFRRSASFSSAESGDDGGDGRAIENDFSSIAKKVAAEVEAEKAAEEAQKQQEEGGGGGGWGFFNSASLI